MKPMFRFKMKVIILLVISPMLHAQETKPSAPQACCSSIIVEDLEQAEQWYSDVLTFKSVSRFVNTDRGISITNMELGTIRLELIEIAKRMEPDSLKSGSKRLQGIFKFGVRVKDFDTWLQHLATSVPDIGKQVVTDPNSKKRMLVIRDPEGNRIQIFEE